MVGRRELETTVLCCRIDKHVSVAVEEVVKRKGITVSRLLNEWIRAGIEKELGLKTDAEILNWSHDYLIESSREARKLFDIALMELKEELSRNRKK